MKLQILEECEHCQSVTQNHTHTHTHTHTCSCRRPTGSRLWCLWRPPSSCGSSSPGCRLCRWAARWGWGVASWCWNRPDLWPARAFLSDEASRHPHLRGEVKELITPAGGQAGSGPAEGNLLSRPHYVYVFRHFSFVFFFSMVKYWKVFPLRACKNVFRWNNQRGNITHSWGYMRPVTRSKHCFVLKGHRRYRLGGDWSLCLWIRTVWMPEECAVSFRVGLGGKKSTLRCFAVLSLKIMSAVESQWSEI